MKQWLIGYDQDVAEWVASHMPFEVTEDQFRPYVAIGLLQDGVLIAGCVYKNYHGHDIEMVLAGVRGWCNRTVIAGLLRYPFEDLKVVRVTAIVGRHNKRSRRLVEGLGFKLEGVVRHGMAERHDAFVFGMVREEAAKWLNMAPRSARSNVLDAGQAQAKVVGNGIERHAA